MAPKAVPARARRDFESPEEAEIKDKKRKYCNAATTKFCLEGMLMAADECGDITFKCDGFELGVHESVMVGSTAFFTPGWAQRHGSDAAANGSSNTRTTLDMKQLLDDLKLRAGLDKRHHGITEDAVRFFRRYLYHVTERGELAEQLEINEIIAVIGMADMLQAIPQIQELIVGDVMDALTSEASWANDDDEEEGHRKLMLAKALMEFSVVSMACPTSDTWEPVKILAAKYIVTEVHQKFGYDSEPRILLSVLGTVCAPDWEKFR